MRRSETWGVQQPADDLELDHVPVAVATAAAAAVGRLQRRLQEAGAGPVVNPAVGQPDQGADLRGTKSFGANGRGSHLTSVVASCGVVTQGSGGPAVVIGHG